MIGFVGPNDVGDDNAKHIGVPLFFLDFKDKSREKNMMTGIIYKLAREDPFVSSDIKKKNIFHTQNTWKRPKYPKIRILGVLALPSLSFQIRHST